MTTHVYRGDMRIDAVDASDRGLAYGDGLFETMRAWRGDLPWWPRHWARLTEGARVLGIALPDEGRARRAVTEVLEGRDGVAKLLVTRGAAGRGYAPGPHAPTWIVSHHPLTSTPGRIALRWCETRLSIQPRLAGIKHCNRLEQVLARAEWTPGETADDGLMCDAEGALTCAVAGNVFLLEDGRWSTPRIDRAGVRGICRGWAVDALGATETRIEPARVAAADAVFVCNAVRGILEVARLGDREWAPHPRIARLRERLASEHPAFEPIQETT